MLCDENREALVGSLFRTGVRNEKRKAGWRRWILIGCKPAGRLPLIAELTDAMIDRKLEGEHAMSFFRSL